MHVISPSDFITWKEDPVTKAFHYAMIDRITEAKEVLANTAGLNSTDDNYLRGFIQAYQEALEFRVDDVQEVSE